MPWNDALTVALTTALEDARTALAEAEREVEAAKEKVEQLRREQHGLELALARHQGQESGLTPNRLIGLAGEDFEKVRAEREHQMARTDAIQEVMAQTPEPLSPAEVVGRLRARGRTDDTPHNVSAALSYLQRQGRVRSLGRGQWVLAETPLPEVGTGTGTEAEARGPELSGEEVAP